MPAEKSAASEGWPRSLSLVLRGIGDTQSSWHELAAMMAHLANSLVHHAYRWPSQIVSPNVLLQASTRELWTCWAYLTALPSAHTAARRVHVGLPGQHLRTGSLPWRQCKCWLLLWQRQPSHR